MELQGKGIEANPQRGKEIYQAKCYFCHGYNGDGKTTASRVLSPRPRNFRDPGEAKGLSDERIFQAIRSGRSGTAMMAYREELSDQEIYDLMAYLKAGFQLGQVK
ncbi:MAG: cytochrome c [Candidatus Tectomicrobia bacterium]|nr:cytochrome c [Candidatus Tectomicrobia bacterium]